MSALGRARRPSRRRRARAAPLHRRTVADSTCSGQAAQRPRRQQPQDRVHPERPVARRRDAPTVPSASGDHERVGAPATTARARASGGMSRTATTSKRPGRHRDGQPQMRDPEALGDRGAVAVVAVDELQHTGHRPRLSCAPPRRGVDRVDHATPCRRPSARATCARRALVDLPRDPERVLVDPRQLRLCHRSGARACLRVQAGHGDARLELGRGAALVDAADRRDVAVVAAVADLHVRLAGEAAVGRIGADPDRLAAAVLPGQQRLDPGVRLDLDRVVALVGGRGPQVAR